MLLKSNNGIKCDICGSEHIDYFTYYSFNNMKCVGAVQTIESSNDICSNCIDPIKRIIIKNNIKNNGIKCDMTGDKLNQNLFYKIKIDKVAVLKSDKFMCDKCNYETKSIEKPCRGCGNHVFISKHIVDVDRENMEFTCNTIESIGIKNESTI